MSDRAAAKDRGTVRVNLEVSPQVRDHIKELQKKSDATSLAEVFRKALAAYDMLLDQKASGGKIVFESKDGEREVIRII